MTSKLKQKVKQRLVYKKPREPHLRVDKMLKAKRVGWRKSKSGNLYYEDRENRSDVNRMLRL